ncbi:MAG: hypothetical protein R3330_02965 [Saprospiraceae bacterium]|nr:hypothetical protein [Saprospiraceae bacterium]
MKWKIAGGLLLFLLAVQCAQYRELPTAPQDRIRQIRPADIRAYHDPVKMEIAWVPYQEHRLTRTSKGEWRVVKDEETDRESAMPMILVSYPGTTDSIWLDMNMDNEMLGRLLKHTLMTQVPLSRPFTRYVEIATCGSCHPRHIDIDF